MIIYTATNTVNNKVYVGKTVCSLKKRIDRHKYEALTRKLDYKFYRAIRRHGFEAFVWETIDTALTNEELCTKEMKYIALYNSFKGGYNSTAGGEGMAGFTHTAAAKAKVSASRKGLTLGSNSPQSKLTEAQVIEIKKLTMQGVSRNKIAKQFNVSRGTITFIQKEETWAHVQVDGFVPTKNPRILRGSANKAATLTEDTVREIKKELIKAELSQKQIAAKTGTTESQVSKIKLGKTWSHVSAEGSN